MKDKTLNQVSIEAGYTYRQGSEVDVDIDGKSFKLFTTYRDGSKTKVGSNAWAYVGGDAELVLAMKSGRVSFKLSATLSILSAKARVTPPVNER